MEAELLDWAELLLLDSSEELLFDDVLLLVVLLEDSEAAEDEMELLVEEKLCVSESGLLFPSHAPNIKIKPIMPVIFPKCITTPFLRSEHYDEKTKG